MSARKTLYFFLILVFLASMAFSGCGLTASQARDHARNTVATYKALYRNYSYMWSKLPASVQKEYEHLFLSFQELIRSGVIREHEFADVKEFKDFLDFLSKNIHLSQTQSQKREK